MANGLTPAEASRAMEAPEIQQFVSSQRVWNDAVGFYGSASKVPAEIKAAIANGIRLDFSTGEPLIRREGCETNGFGCEVKFQTQNAEGMRQAEIAVSNAKSELETLVPQLQGLLDKALSGDLTINPAALSLEIEKTKAKISTAMFIYELCYDTVGEIALVNVLEHVVASNPSNAGGIYGEFGAADVTGFLEISFSDVRRKVFYSNNPGAIETADDVFLLTPSPAFLASGVKLTGEVITSGALRLYETTVGKWLSKEAIQGIPNTQLAGNLTIPGFTAPLIKSDLRHGYLTNGKYSYIGQNNIHATGNIGSGKSQFFNSINDSRLVLDSAAYADEAGLWVGNKAVIAFDHPIGVHAGTGNPTNILNIYRTNSGMIHGTPGTPKQ